MRWLSWRSGRDVTARKAGRPKCGLLLEGLERRIVPSLPPDGTILVATLPSATFAATEQSGSPSGIVGVDPSTGAQTAVATGGSFQLPSGIAEGSNNFLYVADLQASDPSTGLSTGAIIVVDPGQPDGSNQTAVISGNLINGPNAILFINGMLYVANQAAANGAVHAIIKVDPTSHQQTSFSSGDNGMSSGGNTPTALNDTSTIDLSGQTDLAKPWKSNLWAGWSVRIIGGTGAGQARTILSNTATQLTLASAWDTVPDRSSSYEIGFMLPTGMAVPAGANPGFLYVADQPSNSQSGDPGSIWKVNLATGQQTLFSSNGVQGNLLDHPVAVALDGSGNLIVVNTGSTANGHTHTVIRVNGMTGNQDASPIASFGSASGIDSVEVASGIYGAGTIFVGALSIGANPGELYEADPSGSGMSNPISRGGELNEVEGIRAFHLSTQSSTPPQVMPPANQSANEGASKSINLGSFADGSNGPWTATVTWGDGSAATVFSPSGPGSLNSQAHSFAEEGSYTITITVSDTSNNLFGSAMFLVSVSDPNVIMMAGSVSTTAGSPFSGAVATFTDPGGAEANDGTHYSASINWGDNTAASAGTITFSNGVFTVSGSHTYAAAGSYSITVTLHHEGDAAPVSAMGMVASLGQFVAAGLVKPISFWAGLQGQELLHRFGLTASGQSLGQWLATAFPNLYGGQNGAPNLSPFSNAQISSYYQSLFLVSKGVGLDAEVLATALEVFTTTLSLGGTTGQANGFTVNSNGLGAYSWNIGASGQAFGVTNNTVLDVYQILLAANNSAAGGEPWGSNILFRNEAFSVFHALNGG